MCSVIVNFSPDLALKAYWLDPISVWEANEILSEWLNMLWEFLKNGGPNLKFSLAGMD